MGKITHFKMAMAGQFIGIEANMQTLTCISAISFSEFIINMNQRAAVVTGWIEKEPLHHCDIQISL